MLSIPCEQTLPHSPGVYQFKDSEGRIIYIGKAKDLKKRVSSYFQRPDQTPKTAALVRHIHSLDFIITDSEDEAILLESNLIKQHYPKYNVDLKDNAPLTYALITGEPFPRLLQVRKDRHGKIRGPAGKAFGPFMTGSAGRMLGPLRKSFHIRTCGSPMPRHVCLQYHLGNCDGPCEGKITREDYGERVRRAGEILAKPGLLGPYVDEMEGKMRQAAAASRFEEAIRIREAWRSLSGLSHRQKVEALDARDEDYVVLWNEDGHARAQVWRMVHGVIRERLKFEFGHVEKEGELLAVFLARFYERHPIPRSIFANAPPDGGGLAVLEKHLARLRGGNVRISRPPSRGSKLELMRLVEKNMLLEKSGSADPALLRLQKELGLERIPLIIECFDISNLGGEHVVGSMVQLANARPNKAAYRKFRIRTVVGQDDFASIKEAVFRRYRRLRDEGQPMPDLVLIDGGLGQLHAAKDALDQLGLALPLFSLAKENEEVYGLDMLAPLRMEKTNEALHVLQHARNEAHRFVINYNRKLRTKKMFGKKG